ncbi:MAG: type IV toxin-antitoxin system AbiEi family antitoxin domain-containing protein [Nocardioides sp.]|nr:type IV toxin-antitoxin system AbiEi family antitoxin domain-containing protein [Nocardioides sp.]
MDELSEILREQSGVITRRQVLGAGLAPSDLARMLRRRELAVVHRSVFVDHTGPLTWQQRAWAAVLYAWPSALTHGSALRAAEGPGHRGRSDRVIQIAVDWRRHLDGPDGVSIKRMRGFEDRVQWNLGPPRVRYDDAIIDVAAEAPTDLDAVAALADACGSRRTTAARLLRTVDRRKRLRRRTWLQGVLGDVAQGTCSVLEHGYLDLVERPHGLPEGRRQASHRHQGSTVYRDVDYGGLVVELDGRLFHDSTHARDLDLERDLDAAVGGAETVRLGYGQVFERGCSTAARLGLVLQRRGWDGRPTPCAGCP